MSRGWSALLGLMGGLAVLASVVVVHQYTRDDLQRRGHYALQLAEFQLPAPPGMTRDVFIAEVLYSRGLSGKLDRTDAQLTEKLRHAFAAHPWVEKVTVGDLAGPQPIKLVFRTPALSVGERVLDRHGVLLPLGTKKDGLPLFLAPDLAPAAPSGQPYGDARIVAAAKTLGWLRQQAPELQIQAAHWSSIGLVLKRADSATAIWGYSKPDEPSPEQKLARLKTWKGESLDLRNGK